MATNIPDDKLFQFADRVKGQTVVITGEHVSELSRRTSRLLLTSRQAPPTALEEKQQLRSGVMGIPLSMELYSFFVNLQTCSANVVIGDIDLKGSEETAKEVKKVGG